MKAIVKGKVLYYAYEVDMSKINNIYKKSFEFFKTLKLIDTDLMNIYLDFFKGNLLALKRNKNVCVSEKIIRCDYEEFYVFSDVNYICPKGSVIIIKDKQYTIEDVYIGENEVVYHVDYILREYKNQDEHERAIQKITAVIDDNIEFVDQQIEEFNNDNDLVVKDKKWWQFWK